MSGDSADDVANHQQLQAEQDRPAELLAEAAVGAGLMMPEPNGGSTGADQHADDDDGDPGGVDDLPDPLDRMVVVLGAPLSVVPFVVLGVPVRMISVPSAARLKARRRGYLLLASARERNTLRRPLIRDFRCSG